jgi:hypothetical protein
MYPSEALPSTSVADPALCRGTPRHPHNVVQKRKLIRPRYRTAFQQGSWSPPECSWREVPPGRRHHPEHSPGFYFRHDSRRSCIERSFTITKLCYYTGSNPGDRPLPCEFTAARRSHRPLTGTPCSTRDLFRERLERRVFLPSFDTSHDGEPAELSPPSSGTFRTTGSIQPLRAGRQSRRDARGQRLRRD